MSTETTQQNPQDTTLLDDIHAHFAYQIAFARGTLNGKKEDFESGKAISSFDHIAKLVEDIKFWTDELARLEGQKAFLLAAKPDDITIKMISDMMKKFINHKPNPAQDENSFGEYSKSCYMTLSGNQFHDGYIFVVPEKIHKDGTLTVRIIRKSQ